MTAMLEIGEFSMAQSLGGRQVRKKFRQNFNMTSVTGTLPGAAC
jgi:hypothetical protein